MDNTLGQLSLKRKPYLKLSNNIARIFAVMYATVLGQSLPCPWKRQLTWEVLSWVFAILKLCSWRCAHKGTGGLSYEGMVLTFSLPFWFEILNEDGQPHRSERICFPRFLQLPWASTYTLHCVSDRVHPNSGWQCHHCDCDPYRPPPPHPHVLLSKCSFHVGDFLFPGHYPTHAFWPCRSEPIHLPGGLWDSALFLPWFCHQQLLLASSNGVWSLRGHLQPSSLLSHHELEGLYHPGILGLCLRVLALSDSGRGHFQTVFLQLTDWAFLLWCSTCVGPSLCCSNP